MLEQSLAEDCTYTDPQVQLAGHADLSNYMSGFQKNAPGARFVTVVFKTHHDRSLAHWNVVDGNDRILGQGASFAVYGGDGRLQQMSGVF